MSVYVYYISVLRKRLSGDSIFLLLLLMSGISAQAQIHQMVRKDSSAIDRTYNLNPVVVTGSGHHQRLKSTATPVRVLSSQEISEQGITTFDGALTRMMPQASMAPNAMGTFLRLNGLGNKYILILINGQKLSGDISNNVDLNRINMARVKRIEVLDGAASSLYGSDAIAGVINIITDQPTQNLISITSDTKVSGHGIMTEAVSLDIYKNVRLLYLIQSRPGRQLSNQRRRICQGLRAPDTENDCPLLHWLSLEHHRTKIHLCPHSAPCTECRPGLFIQNHQPSGNPIRHHGRHRL